MRLGIRAKLVGTLLLAGLLPLALALAFILVWVVEGRINSRGQTFRALAQQQARHLSSILSSQVELANLINGQPGTLELLAAANAAPPLTQAEIDQTERAWPKMSPAADPLLTGILENPLARRWQSVATAEARFSEVMITDASGRLVAATNKTTDYYQADEEWWQGCFAGGKGRVLIWNVKFDPSARGPGGKVGTLVADLCLPIYDAGNRVAGVTKVSLDATWMLRQVNLESAGVGGEDDGLPRATWLVQEDGKAVDGATVPPPVPVLPERVVRKLRAHAAGWTKEDDLPGYELLGFAAVEQSRMIEQASERWHVVVATGAHEVVASVHRLAWIIMGTGLAVIAACFVGGWWIARREIVRPLLTLEDAVNDLKAGNRDVRLPVARGGRATFRDDEIGRLAREFNVMADQLKRNLEQIEQADAVKRQFIDLASHELRTPVTYILGAAQLAQRQAAAGGNGDGSEDGGAGAGNHSGHGACPPIMTKIAGKAQRLNRIVENMFKLLAADRFERSPRMADTDLAAIVRAVCAEDDVFLKERRQTWQVELPADLPTIRADAEKVRDIVANLVSNAIRFSPDGGTVGVRAAAVDGGGVEIAVSDTGTGIPPQDMPNLFEPFFTGQNTARHSSGDFGHMSRGMGLGLSVVKRFVALHNGTVAVDTGPAGTTIRVRLPLDPDAAAR